MRNVILLLLAGSLALAAAEPAKIVFVAGSPSHGPGDHEYRAGLMLLAKCARENKGVETVVVKNGWPEDEAVFNGARTIVLYSDGGTAHPWLKGNRLQTIGKLMDKGVGLVCLHYAVEVPKEHGGTEFLKWIGGYYERPYSKNPFNDIEITQAAPDHPISRGWKSFRLRDEWYYRMRFTPGDKRVTYILTAMLPKDAPNREALAWATERADGGRGFGYTGGHPHTNWGVAEVRLLVTNAILWTAHVDVPRHGAKCKIKPEDLKQNLDDKRKKK
jgi:type 1 glutamine amidotransferase